MARFVVLQLWQFYGILWTIMDEVSKNSSAPVVSGLQGLRELIRAQQMSSQAANNDDNNGDDDKKLTRRRGRSKSGPQVERMELPFTADDIVYAEIIDKKDDQSDVKLFVGNDERLLIYSNRVYPGQEAEYREAAKYMARTGKNMKRSMAGGVEMLVNKSARLAVDEEGILYNDRFRVICANEKVTNRVIEIIKGEDKKPSTKSTDAKIEDKKPANQATNGEVNQVNESKKANKTVEAKTEIKTEKTNKSDKSDKSDKADKSNKLDDTNNSSSDAKVANTGVETQKPAPSSTSGSQEIIDKIVEVQNVVNRIKNGKIEPRDLMKVFLTVGQASPELAKQLLHIDDEMIDSLIDELRRLRALGHQQKDGKYPILIKDLGQLGEHHEYKLQTSADNFRSVVHTETVKYKEIYYDLEELSMVKAADELMEKIGVFCRSVSSEQLDKLWSWNSNRIPVSEVLRCMSSDVVNDGMNVGDYELFNSYVSKYMFGAGWLSRNPSDGYPWVIFQVSKTNGLKIDMLRYVINNINWISAIYPVESLASLASQISNMELASDRYGAENLRARAIQLINSAIDDASEFDSGEIDSEQLEIK